MGKGPSRRGILCDSKTSIFTKVRLKHCVSVYVRGGSACHVSPGQYREIVVIMFRMTEVNEMKRTVGHVDGAM